MELGAADALGEYEELTRGLIDELSASDVDVEAAATLCADTVRATRRLLLRTNALPLNSPYRGVAFPEAEALLRQVTEQLAAAAHPPAGARALVDLHAEFVHALGRDDAARLLASARGSRPLRALARLTGVSLGHLSDLERGRAGPPSPRSATALDAALGSDLTGLVSSTRARTRELRDLTLALAARLPAAPPSRSESGRLAAITSAISHDRSLLELAERLVAAPRPIREGIAALLTGVAVSLPGETGGRR